MELTGVGELRMKVKLMFRVFLDMGDYCLFFLLYVYAMYETNLLINLGNFCHLINKF